MQKDFGSLNFFLSAGSCVSSVIGAILLKNFSDFINPYTAIILIEIILSILCIFTLFFIPNINFQSSKHKKLLQEIKNTYTTFKTTIKDSRLKNFIFYTAIISSLIYISIPMICGYITDKLFLLEKHEALGRLGWFAFALGILFCVQFFCKRYVKYRGVLYATRIEIDIENQLFEHLHKQDFGFYSKKETGELVSLFTSDAFRLRDLFRRLPEFGLDITLIFLFSGFDLAFFFLFATSISSSIRYR